MLTSLLLARLLEGSARKIAVRCGHADSPLESDARVPASQLKATMRNSDNKQRNIFHENVIRIGAGFVAKEHSHVVETLSTLGPHLGRWGSRDVSVDVSLQGRGGKEQRVTLRTSLPGLTPLIAVAENPDITRALGDAKRELIRQLESAEARQSCCHGRPTMVQISLPALERQFDRR